MTRRREILSVAITLKPETEVEVIAWLSKHLEHDEWSRVLTQLGKQRIRELPVAVLSLAVRCKMIVTEVYRVQKLADLEGLSYEELASRLNSVAMGALLGRMHLFGLELRQ